MGLPAEALAVAGLPRAPRPGRLLPPPPRCLPVTSKRGIFQLVISAASTPVPGDVPGHPGAPRPRRPARPRPRLRAAPGPAAPSCQESELREVGAVGPRALPGLGGHCLPLKRAPASSPFYLPAESGLRGLGPGAGGAGGGEARRVARGSRSPWGEPRDGVRGAASLFLCK